MPDKRRDDAQQDRGTLSLENRHSGKTDASMTSAWTAILLTEAATLLFDARTVLDLQSEIHGDYFPAKLEAARESLEAAEHAYELDLAEYQDAVERRRRP